MPNHEASNLPVLKVVAVNVNEYALELFEPILGAGRYDMVFVAAGYGAYTEIRKIQPDLVILSVEFEERDGFELLSMLKLDPATCDIPVIILLDQAENSGPYEAKDTLGIFEEDEEEENDYGFLRPVRKTLN